MVLVLDFETSGGQGELPRVFIISGMALGQCFDYLQKRIDSVV